MATLTQVYKADPAIFKIAKKFNKICIEFLPRRCMLVSTGLILAGLGIPLLMAMELLPITLVLAFIGLALTATGGTLAFIYYGEL